MGPDSNWHVALLQMGAYRAVRVFQFRHPPAAVYLPWFAKYILPQSLDHCRDALTDPATSQTSIPSNEEQAGVSGANGLTPNVQVKWPPTVWRFGRADDDKQHGPEARVPSCWRSA